jgi:Ca2+-binding RTX toxin-like protein
MDLGNSGLYVQTGDPTPVANDAIAVGNGVITELDTFDSIENIIGSNYNDTLVGDSMANVIEGGRGNDIIDGGDNINGYDIVSYEHSLGAVTASLMKTGTPQNTVSAGRDTLINMEGLLGSGFNDTLTGDNGNNLIDGGLGDDTINGLAGNDTIYAGKGHDTVYAGDNNDTIYVSSLSVNLPDLIDGGLRDAGNIKDHGGNVMILQDLVNGSSYSMTNLASHTTNIDTLNISGDGAATSITISGLDVQQMVNNANASELYIKADSGDTLNISLAAGETMTPAVIDTTHTDYTIFNASHAQIAQIHWHS